MPAALLARPQIRRLGPDSICRQVTVQPGMCGHNSLFVGQVGDWTWETVSEVCETDAFNARDAAGAPTYLSFYYYRLHGSRSVHPRTFSFGQRLEVLSRVFTFGSESVLTLHRIRLVGAGAPVAGSPLEPAECYDQPRPDCLYVENFNRWITRGGAGNEGLLTASPVGYRHEHLPRLPDRYSPRRVFGLARQRGSFHDPADPGYTPGAGWVEMEHPVDLTRDLNGVGLIYFAAYFGMVDEALLAFWRRAGRCDASFLRRIVLDQKVCYLGNADPGAVLTIGLRSWRCRADPAEELVDVVVRHGARPVAVCLIRLLLEDQHAAG